MELFHIDPVTASPGENFKMRCAEKDLDEKILTTIPTAGDR
jgi:hypothetical protein